VINGCTEKETKKTSEKKEIHGPAGFWGRHPMRANNIHILIVFKAFEEVQPN
jgi:hypothetical protein